MAPKARIATLTGTWIKPGVSLNGRLYTAGHIAAAALEAQEQIDSGKGPRVFTMLTHHGARKPDVSDVTRTAGRLTKVAVDSRGYGTFEAELADTTAGNDVAALTVPDADGKPTYLKGVSMASVWKSPPRQMAFEGSSVVSADEGFSLRGIDFTHDPGVPEGAEITGVQIEEGGPEETIIFESCDEIVVEAKGDPTPDAPATSYADPGYQKDGKKRYPLNTKGRIRSAWSYINKASNAAKYTEPQVARIKGKIKKAAKGQGIKIEEDLKTFGTEILEAYVAMSADNGPGSVSVNAYGVDGADIGKAAQIVAMAALAALYQLDPDMDGDLDLDRFDTDEDNDNSMDSSCGVCGASADQGDNFCAECGAPIEEVSTPDGKTVSEERKGGGDMPTDKTDGGAAPNEAELTDREKALIVSATEAATAKVYESLGRNADGTEKPVEESAELKAARALIEEADKGKAAPAAPVTEAAPTTPIGFDPAAFAEELVTKVTKSVSESVKADLIEEMRKAPQRKGHVPRSVLEEAPETVYGEDPGDRGRNLRTKSLQELEALADGAFTPLIAANA